MKIKAAVITASDKGYSGERKDQSGPLLCDLLKNKGVTVSAYKILPDEKEMLANQMKKLIKSNRVDLILTTGGTGLSPRDVTPEATLELCDKEVAGISEAMRAMSLSKSKNAMLSRAVAVISNKTLIVNMPGSPKAVNECFEFIWQPVMHAIELINNRVTECASKQPTNNLLSGF